MSRRRALATIGGTVTAMGIGGATVFSSTAAAATVNIGASAPGVIANDRGDVSAVTIDPAFRVEWANLDEAVSKVFYLIEAAVQDPDGRAPTDGGYTGTGFHPIFRATPWLSSPVANSDLDVSRPGTTGHFEIRTTHTQALARDSRFSSTAPHPLVVADEDGRPDYASFDFSGIGGVDLASYLDGTSMGGAANYADPAVVGTAVVQNNFPAIDAGYYGAATDTSMLDNPVDGTQSSTRLFLRYTFELLRPNASQVSSATLGQGDWVNVRASDVVSGNSEIVMNGEDGNYDFATPTGISYADLQAHAADHVGALVATAAFDVTVQNQAADAGVTGTSNTGATGGGQ